MKKLLILLIASFGKSLDCLASDPVVKSAMPSEMYDIFVTK